MVLVAIHSQLTQQQQPPPPSYSIPNSMPVTIKVLFFASAREAAGDISKANLELQESEANTQGLRQKLAQAYPSLAEMVLDQDNLTLALNEEYVTSVQPLKDGDTVALIPPISGG